MQNWNKDILSQVVRPNVNIFDLTEFGKLDQIIDIGYK